MNLRIKNSYLKFPQKILECTLFSQDCLWGTVCASSSFTGFPGQHPAILHHPLPSISYSGSYSPGWLSPPFESAAAGTMLLFARFQAPLLHLLYSSFILGTVCFFLVFYFAFLCSLYFTMAQYFSFRFSMIWCFTCKLEYFTFRYGIILYF